MIKYAKIINNETGLVEVGIGTNTAFYKSIGMFQLDVQLSDVDGRWYLKDKCPMKTEEEKAQKEAERLAMLNLTRGDVFRGLLLAKGITKTQIAQMIEAMPVSTQEEIVTKELALIDFEDALNFYRGNELIDTIGLALGISKGQLDKFFDYGNSEDTTIKANAYKYLTTCKVTIYATPETANVTINGNEGSTLTIEYGQSVEYTVSADGYMSTTGNIESITEDTTVNVELVKLPEEDITPDEGNTPDEDVEDSTTDSIEGDTEVSPDITNDAG